MKDKLPEISREKQKLFSRIKRLGGQIGAVERAVSEGDECADILMLLAAIRGGVNSLMAEILEDHIRLHITHPKSRTGFAGGTDGRFDFAGESVFEVKSFKVPSFNGSKWFPSRTFLKLDFIALVSGNPALACRSCL